MVQCLAVEVMPRVIKQKQHDACIQLLHHVLLCPASNELLLLLQVNRNCNCCLLITQQRMAGQQLDPEC
jgi:hypothetical protein